MAQEPLSYSENRRKEIIKQIQHDFDDIQYMLKNVDLIQLSDNDLQELYSKNSKVWLILSSIYK
jgi:protein-arginine kinase